MTDDQKTQVYGSSDDLDKTTAYRSEPSSPKPEDRSKPEPKAEKPQDKTKTHDLGTGDKVELNLKEYEITDIISGDDVSGEAVVYRIKDSENDKLVLKLYYQFENPADEPRSEPLSRIRKMMSENVLKLHDFGTGANKYKGKFCFEINDYAEGGDLLSVPDIKRKYTPDFLEGCVIPALLNGIKTFHEHQIYHCDIKPQNIYYLDQAQTKLVLADYGSAKTFSEDTEKELVKTAMVKGTDFYLAPEQARGVISSENDYYSLGMTLLHLLYPEKLTSDNLNKIIERQFAGKPIIDYSPEFERLNRLIAGLTLQDRNDRWGKEEVERWLKGEEVEVDYPSDRGVIPIKIGKKNIRTVEELMNYIGETNNWHAILIEDPQGCSMLLTWLASLQDLPRKKIFDKMIEYYREDGPQYVKEAIVRYFNPEKPVELAGKSFDFYGEAPFKEVSDQVIEYLDDVWKSTDIEELKFSLFQLEFALGQLMESVGGNVRAVIRAFLDKMGAAFNTALKMDFSDRQAVLYAETTDVRIVRLLYAFNPERGVKVDKDAEIKDVEAVGLFFAKNEAKFNDPKIKIELNQFLAERKQSRLAELNYKSFLIKLFEKQAKDDLELRKIQVTSGSRRGNIRIEYRLGKSLTEYFADQGIDKEITQWGIRTEVVTVKGVSDFFEAIKNKHKLEENQFDRQVRDKLSDRLKDEKHAYRAQKMKANYTEVAEGFGNFFLFTFKSIVFLLPVFMMLLIYLATVKNDQTVINILNMITPFKLSFTVNFESLKDFSLYGMHYLIAISLLPTFVMSFFEDLEATSGAKGILINLIAFLAAAPFLIIVLIYLMLLVWSWIGPWLSGAGGEPAKLSPDILTQILYYFPGILLVLVHTAASFAIRQQFRFIPFLLSIGIYLYFYMQISGFKLPGVEEVIQKGKETVKTIEEENK